MIKKKALFFLFFAAFVLLLNLMIPPMQNPDEPQHFAAVMAFAKNESPANAPQSEIIRLMDKNQWWRFLGMGRPEPLPRNIASVAFLMGYYKVSDFTLFLNDILIYHFAAGKIIGLITKDNISWAYSLARLISIFLIAGALYLFYLTLKRIPFYPIVPDEFPWPILGFLFILFLPQFLINSVSVNPDCLSIFLSSIFFFATFSLIQQDRKFRMVLILVSVVLAGLIVDRANFFMLPSCLLAIFFSIDRKNIKKIIGMMAVLLASLALLFILLKLFFPSQLAKGYFYAESHLPHGWHEIISLFSLSSLNKRFIVDLIDSFFLKFGWSAFSAAPIVYEVWLAIIALALIGILTYIGKSVFKKAGDHPVPNESGSRDLGAGLQASRFRRLVYFSLTAVVLQILAVRMLATERNMFAQGRYLFPLVAPIAFLFVIGLKNFFDILKSKASLGTLVIKIFILLEFLFLNYIIWSEIVPVFHITLNSPHPGA